MRQYLHNLREQLKPNYHELTAYLTAMTCALLFVFYPEFRQGYLWLLIGGERGPDMPTLTVLMALATLGFFFAFIQVFMKRKKTWFEKICMGVLIMGANGCAGIAAGLEMLPSPWSLTGVIALWNIFIGVVLLYQIGASRFDITDDNASLVEVVWTSVLLLIIFTIAKFQFQLTWAATFSLCMVYSSIIFLLVSWTTHYFRSPSFSGE